MPSHANFRRRRLRAIGLRLLPGLALGFWIASAQAMVPASERAVLDAIYYGTGGIPPGGGSRTWIDITGWGLPVFLGISECESYGVSCIVDQGQEHVSGIELEGNGLTGSLPPTLTDLPYLQTFGADDNHISGSIPELTGLTKLVYFSIYGNQLTGEIPSLSGLAELAYFEVDGNQLTGAIPSLVGLNNLQIFIVCYNQLAGPIPPIGGLTHLEYFVAFNNHLTGTLPAIAGMTALRSFDVGTNLLTGAIPPLSGLSSLGWFSVRNNDLSGPIPPLADLVSLDLALDVSGNRLSGLIPAAPVNLYQAWLCPNLLTITDQPGIDPAWNTATGYTPWWATPSAGNTCDELLYGDFEFVGGPF